LVVVADALGASFMEPAANKESRITALNKEIDTIYFADRQYWDQSERATHDMRIEHQRRKERLEEIRKELAQLRSAQSEQNCGQGAMRDKKPGSLS
jgi:hypothetical protein